MEQPSYVIRPVQAADDPEILRLLATTMGETEASPQTTRYWQWKHRENPNGQSLGAVAQHESDGVVASLGMMMRWSFCAANGERHRGARAGDTATYAEHQRRGLFTKIIRACVAELEREDVTLIYGTPNANSLPGYQKMNWAVVTRWPLYIRPVLPLRAVTRLLRSRLFGSAPPPLKSTRDSPPPTWAEFAQGSQASVMNTVRAHESGRRRVGYRTERSWEWLNWRYGASPAVTYNVYADSSASSASGFAVTRPVRGTQGLQAMVLADMFLREPSVSAARRLIRRVMRARHCDYLLAHFADRTLEHRALRQLGFMPSTRRGYTFIVNGLRPGPHDPAQRQSWDLTLGDLEIF